jgi:hypothetical protein
MQKKNPDLLYYFEKGYIPASQHSNSSANIKADKHIDF